MKLKSHFSKLTSVLIPLSNVFLGTDGNTDVSASYHHYLLFQSPDILLFLLHDRVRSTIMLCLSTIKIVLAVLPNPLGYLVTPTCCFPSLCAPKYDQCIQLMMMRVELFLHVHSSDQTQIGLGAPCMLRSSLLWALTETSTGTNAEQRKKVVTKHKQKMK